MSVTKIACYYLYTYRKIMPVVRLGWLASARQLHVTVYTKTNHMSAKIFAFSADIAKAPPDGPSVQTWSRLLIACPK